MIDDNLARAPSGCDVGGGGGGTFSPPTAGGAVAEDAFASMLLWAQIADAA